MPAGKLKPTTLSSRIGLVFGTGAVLTVAILLLVWYFGIPALALHGARDRLIQEAINFQNQLADNQQMLISNDLRERRDDVEFFAESDTLAARLRDWREGKQGAAASLQSTVGRLSERMQSAYTDRYLRLQIIDPRTRRIIASSDASDPGRAIPAHWVEQALLPNNSEHLSLEAGSDGLELIIARQVQDPDGHILAVLAAYAQPYELDAGISPLAEHNLGQTGAIYLYDWQGYLVSSHQRHSGDVRGAAQPLNRHGIEGSFFETGPNGREQLATYRLIRVGASEGWTLVIRRDTSDALTPLHGLAFRASLFALVLSAILILVVIVLARRITARISAMTDVAEAIARGETERRVPAAVANRNDDIGHLAAVFNTMVEKLESWNAVLDREVRKRTVELDAEKAAAQRYLDIAAVMLLALDRNGRITMINQAGKVILGVTESDVIGRDWFASFVPERLRASVRDVFLRLMTGETEIVRNYENPVIRLDGREREIAWRNILITDEAGHAQGILACGIDITDRKATDAELARHRAHLEELVGERTTQLAEARDQAEAANRAKSAFIANMSHEIRTPLNAITGMAHLLRRDGVSARQADRLDKIDTASQHLLAIINDILDLSKIEAGKFALEETELSVGTIVADVASILADRATAKHLTLLVDNVSLPRYTLLGDPTRLRQLLLNYASNAIKFTERGSITLTAETLEDNADNLLLRLSVKDEGPGVDPATLSRLFAPFEQADSSTTRTHGGTGLGLAINRRLAELMGGSAGCTSQPGKGSTFWATVRLRKSGKTLAPPNHRAGESAEMALRRQYSGREVLLVEDEAVNREVALAILQDVGLTVGIAHDGLEAVNFCIMKRYDLILMDMQMPEMDGLEATRQIRKLDNGKDVPIVAMTANAFIEDRQRCFDAGMDDFVAKPVDPDTLFEILLRRLSDRRHDEAGH